MSNAVVVFQEDTGLELAPEFLPMMADGLSNDLSDGVGGGFASMSIRGGKFRIKHKGDEFPITDHKGDPVGSIEVVIIRANAHLTKQWFEKSFDENSPEASGPPTCFSLDGVAPADTVQNKQAKTCAMCPKNAFGSAPRRKDGSVSKGKACADNRKLAVVPIDDIDNERFGGPML